MTGRDNNHENEFELFEDVIKLDLGNGIVLDLLRVTAGAFTMADRFGSTSKVFTTNEHQVTLQEF